MNDKWLIVFVAVELELAENFVAMRWVCVCDGELLGVKLDTSESRFRNVQNLEHLLV